jgi:hypothetical protein
VSSRIELILKLGNTTGKFETEKPGRSTVDGNGENTENRGRLNLRMGWVTFFRDPISTIGKELDMKSLLKPNNLLVITVSLLLLFVNWLAFHDFREIHTVRDWLMLIASALVFLKFARDFWNQHFERV